MPAIKPNAPKTKANEIAYKPHFIVCIKMNIYLFYITGQTIKNGHFRSEYPHEFSMKM